MSGLNFYTAQEGHVAQLIPPASYSSTQTSPKLNLGKWRHATILLLMGSAGTPPVVTLDSSDDGSPENTTAVAFNLHKQENGYNAANGDVFGARVANSNAGFTPVSTNNILYAIEIDASTLPAGQPYIKLILTSPTSCFLAAVAILSAGRDVADQSASVLG